MAAPELERLLDELRNWCGEERGRQAEIAELLGVSRSWVNDWLMGRREPGTNEYLTLREFLKRQRRRSTRLEEGKEKESE
jgi:transcriptional regulator with XRE-family HTH domain